MATSSTIPLKSSDNNIWHDEEYENFSLPQFIEDLDCAIRWEQLNGCQEAAYEDIPPNYSDCLSVFSTRVSSGDRVQGCLSYQNLLSLLDGTHMKQPMPLAPPLYDLSEEDKLSVKNVLAHGLSEVQLTAAVYSPKVAITHDASISKVPAVASAVITSSKEVFGRKVSFYTLRRYNRLGTTSILRTACSIGIDIPVIGILLCYNLVAIHIDWYQIVHGEFTCNSAFYPANSEEVEIKVWDLNRPDDAQQIAQIFSNIHSYTVRHVDSRIRENWCQTKMGTPGSLQKRFFALHLDDIPSPPSTPDFSY